jgi:bifunctional ADP-heptose synthase (sugar kinase/adenylyltransferase)
MHRSCPTYTKPMVRTANGERELERLDIKNRAETPADLEARVTDALDELYARGGSRVADGVIVLDQAQERNCGTVTDAVRAALARLGAERPERPAVADSRVRIAEFGGVILKPNKHEAAASVYPGWAGDATLSFAAECGCTLAARTGRPVFVTVGEDGIVACTAEDAAHVPALPVREPIDIVGAGDSATAGILCALCAGAAPAEAAFVGNLCAAVTIRKLGTTGTASQDELLARYDASASAAMR